jgi:hypothetical protein
MDSINLLLAEMTHLLRFVLLGLAIPGFVEVWAAADARLIHRNERHPTSDKFHRQRAIWKTLSVLVFALPLLLFRRDPDLWPFHLLQAGVYSLFVLATWWVLFDPRLSAERTALEQRYFPPHYIGKEARTDRFLRWVMSLMGWSPQQTMLAVKGPLLLAAATAYTAVMMVWR